MSTKALLKEAGPLRLAATTNLACDWLSRRASKARPSGQAAQSSDGTEFTATQAPTGALERDLDWVGQPEVAVQGTAAPGSASAVSLLSSGRVGEPSHRADSLLRDCKGGAAAQRLASPDVRPRTCLVLSLCLPA